MWGGRMNLGNIFGRGIVLLSQLLNDRVVLVLNMTNRELYQSSSSSSSSSSSRPGS